MEIERNFQTFASGYHTLLALVVRQLAQFFLRLSLARCSLAQARCRAVVRYRISTALGCALPYSIVFETSCEMLDGKGHAARIKRDALVRPGIPVVPWRTASSAASVRSHSPEHPRLFNPLGP